MDKFWAFLCIFERMTNKKAFQKYAYCPIANDTCQMSVVGGGVEYPPSGYSPPGFSPPECPPLSTKSQKGSGSRDPYLPKRTWDQRYPPHQYRMTDRHL